jgi:GDP-mannose 4,6-dehydratase
MVNKYQAVSGLPLITVKLMTCMTAMAFCLIMNRLARSETFVTRKITRGLSNIAMCLEPCLFMGNMDSFRDWGHAKDFVRMQWMMMQQEQPDDFVIATGVQYSVRQFMAIYAHPLEKVKV